MSCEPLTPAAESLFPNWNDENEIFADGCANGEQIVCNLQSLANALTETNLLAHVPATIAPGSDPALTITGQQLNLDLSDIRAKLHIHTCANVAIGYHTYNTAGIASTLTAPQSPPATPAVNDLHLETYTDGVSVTWRWTGATWTACAVDTAKIAVRVSTTQTTASNNTTLALNGAYTPTRLLRLHKNNWQYELLNGINIPNNVITPLSTIFVVPSTGVYNFSATTTFPASAVGRRETYVRINGGGWIIISTLLVNSASSLSVFFGLGVSGLTAGDTIEYGVFQNSGATVSIIAVLQNLEVY